MKAEAILAAHPMLGLIGNTRLIALDVLKELAPGVEVLAKFEAANPGGSLKDRPVRRMLCEALASGALTPDKTVLDSSSGNAGIAYAMIASVLGLKVELVVPGNASIERKRRILAHGATLTQTDPLLGYDEALRHCHRLHHDNPEKYFLCNQYANEFNWRAHYDGTGAEILDQTGGRLTHFVAGIGTGGTLTGVGRRLKETVPGVRIVCIVPESFPGIEGLKPLERPEDIRPEILDESVIDERIPVTAEEAYDWCRALALRGLFVGQSSGAYLAGVAHVARREKKARVVTLLNDIGERYFSTGLWD